MAAIHFNHISRILVSRLRFMGDVILTTPILRQLRKCFPNAFIAYLTEDQYAPLLQNNPNLDEIIPLFINRRSGESAGRAIIRQMRFFQDLRQKRFDLTIDLFGNPRSALLSWISGAQYRVGGDFRGRGLLYNLRIEQSDKQFDAIEFHQQSLRRLGLETGSKKTEVILSEAEKQQAKTYLQEQGFNFASPIIALHPGASWPNKIWPTEYFSKLADRLAAEGVQIFVTCAPGEEAVVRRLKQFSASDIVLGKTLSIRLLASVLQDVTILISNDCGVMHLGVAVGTPTIGIFGPGEPEIWFPYNHNEGHRAFYSTIECRPCHQNECPIGTLECMHHTRPDMVYHAAMQILKSVKANEI